MFCNYILKLFYFKLVISVIMENILYNIPLVTLVYVSDWIKNLTLNLNLNKLLHRNVKLVQQEPHLKSGVLQKGKQFLLHMRIRRVTISTNPAISHEWGNDLIVITTNETYPWPFVTQILRSGLPSHGGDRNIFEVMKSYLSKKYFIRIRLHFKQSIKLPNTRN